ncbi:MAG: hypothetical protein AAF682_32490, partial [Planctomycetota bacterium]
MLGYGRSGALGLALYVAGWALGARLATALVRGLRPALVVAGAGVLLGGEAAVRALFAASLHAAPDAVALAAGAAALLLPAAFQGMLLPLFLRVREERSGARGGIDGLWAASLAGAVAGAAVFADLAVARLGRPPAVELAGARPRGRRRPRLPPPPPPGWRPTARRCRRARRSAPRAR